VARLWTAYCGRELDYKDVLIMMALMKIGRCESRPGNSDNWVDACGYLSLAGEG
jgi:hypothetical protein